MLQSSNRSADLLFLKYYYNHHLNSYILNTYYIVIDSLIHGDLDYIQKL